MIAQMIPRVIKLLTKPQAYWDEMVSEPGDVPRMLPAIVVLSALPAIAFLLGVGIIGGFLFSRYLIFPVLFGAVGQFGTNVLVWFVLAYFIDFFAPKFGGQADPQQARKLATAIIPCYLGGILAITSSWSLMSLGAVAGLGYAVYLLYLGLPTMNGTPRDKAIVYAIVVVVCTLVAIAVMNALLRIPTSCCTVSTYG